MTKQVRFFWVRLKEDFFYDKITKAIRRLPSGDTILIIYLKMYMKSVNDSFCFYYEGVETTFEDELALYLDEDVNAVRLTIQALLRYKLITVS